MARPAAQISVLDTPPYHVHNETMALVEWACTPMGHCRPKEEYASVTASTIHLEQWFSTRGLSLIQMWPTECYSLRAEHNNKTFIEQNFQFYNSF